MIFNKYNTFSKNLNAILGSELQKHPKVVVHAINSDKPTLTPYYDKNNAMVSCYQLHPDYLLQIPRTINELIKVFIRYFDIKANNDDRFSHCRLSLIQDLIKLSFKDIKNIMQGYVTTLQEETKKNKNIHYIRLLYKLRKILDDTTNKEVLLKQWDAFNELLKSILFDKNYKDLFPSFIADAGIDYKFIELYDKHFKITLENMESIVVSHEILFLINSTPIPEKITEMMRELIKYFPEEEQQSMWHNFERFGVPLIKEI